MNLSDNAIKIIANPTMINDCHLAGKPIKRLKAFLKKIIIEIPAVSRKFLALVAEPYFRKMKGFELLSH